MATYRYLLVDASSGVNKGELPLSVQSFSRLLNGVGVLTGTLPMDHPMSTWQNLLGDREITVLRDDVPIWNGPITTLDVTLSGRQVAVTAREASWYLGKRTLEVNKNYNADLYYIVRNLVTYMTTKLGTGASNINAPLPRFSVSPAGNSGTVKAYRYYGSARHTLAEILDDLVADPTTGLDYRMDYTTGSTRQTCQRTLTLGSPSLGATRSQRITEALVTEYSRSLDRERAASRVHVLGNGYTATAQNTGSVSNGDILIESVFDRTDKSNHSFLDNYARDARYRSQPSVLTHSVSFKPGSALPYGFCDVGDKVDVEILVGSGLLISNAGTARVLEIDVTPNDGNGDEIVTLSLATSLDSLGT